MGAEETVAYPDRIRGLQTIQEKLTAQVARDEAVVSALLTTSRTVPAGRGLVRSG
jgi:hypothetical protein